jgi:hypothetical protein
MSLILILICMSEFDSVVFVVVFLKYIKIIFFIFKKLFLILIHQNNLKIKKINFKQKFKFKFLKNIISTTFSNNEQ